MRKKAQFGQVISGYVDPTPEGLDKAYQRHMDNLMNSEAIRQEAAKLKAAPFEGDQQLRRDLLTTSDKALQAIVGKASYGNLSNFTSAVNRASTEFQKKAAPIAQNQQMYSAYQSKVGDLLEKGKIDAEDAQGNILLSTMGYKGLSYDEDGEATGYFNGKTVYQNPGIQDMINKALSNVEPDSWKEVRKVLGAGADGSLTVETEQGEKYISADKVSAALAGVSNDPAVLGYYNRKGEIRTAMKNDEQVVGTIGGMIKVQAERADAARSAMADAKTPEEKAALQGRIDQATKDVGDLQSMMDDGRIDDMRSKLVEAERDQLINTPIMAAINAKSSMNTVDSVKQGYDAKWMADYKQRLKDISAAAAAGTSAIEITEDAVTYNRIGGDNAADLYVKMEETSTALDGLYEQYQTDFARMSESGQLSITQQIRDKELETRMQHNLFMDLYKQVPDELFDTDEYRDIKNRAENLAPAAPNIGAVIAAKIKGNAARRELRDYLRNLNLESPVGGRTAISVNYIDPTSVGAPSDVNAKVKAHFAGGFDPTQIVINPDTGEDTTLKALLGNDFEGITFANFGVSKGAPMEMGPTMRVGYTNEDGSAGSFIMPIGPDGTQLRIPGLTDYYYSHGGSVFNELLTYREEGLESIEDIPWYSEADPSARGTMSADLTTAEGGTITITSNTGHVTKLGLQSAEFQERMNTNKIVLR